MSLLPWNRLEQSRCFWRSNIFFFRSIAFFWKSNISRLMIKTNIFVWRQIFFSRRQIYFLGDPVCSFLHQFFSRAIQSESSLGRQQISMYKSTLFRVHVYALCVSINHTELFTRALTIDCFILYRNKLKFGTARWIIMFVQVKRRGYHM